MPSTLTVTKVNAGTQVSFTAMGGSGTPQNPYEWRITDSNPLFAQPTLHTYTRKAGKDVDQVVIKIAVPYALTDSTTTEVVAKARAEATLTFNVPRTVPQSTVDALMNLSWSTLCYLGVNTNLLVPLEARQAG